MTANAPGAPLLAAGVLVDLDNCACEPIHIPGSIQPRGVLLAIREMSMTVVHASMNLSTVIGVAAEGVVGQPLSAAVGESAATTIERATAVFGDPAERNPHDVVIAVDEVPVQFDAILRRVAGGLLLVELETAIGARPISFPNTYLAVRVAVSDLNQAADLSELYDITTRAVQNLTGFDRVMIYRYDSDFNGEVVAETKRADLEPFLGLHYPASDIPAQARALYEKNWIRLISDVGYEPVPLVPTLDPLTGDPLDLSLSTLRSVSPIHIEYLHNMKVRASMSISLLRHGTLWGLIACHHYSAPHTPPYEVRAAAEFLGATLSLRLVDRAEEIELRASLESQALLARLTAATLDDTTHIVDALLGSPSVLDLIAANGASIVAEGHTASRGVVPDELDVRAIADWARSTGDEVVVTDSLALTAPELTVPPHLASGVLALMLPDGQHVIWFRAEASHAVDWSGDPHSKMISVQEDDTVRMSPRKSFDRWREIVRLRSKAWSAGERELAGKLRRQTVEALYTRAQRGLHLAETLQRNLLPANLPTVAGWSISAHYEVAEGGQVGGDWYDAFLLSEDTLAVILGDVAGHGITAAGTMAQLRNVLRGHLFDTGSPAQALTKLNTFMTTVLPDAFATAIVARIDTSTGQVAACSAGHLTPYVIGSAGEALRAPLPTSLPLGARGTNYVASEFVLPPGAGLVLYSDGLIERRTEDIGHSLHRFASALTRLGPRPTAAEVFAALGRPQALDDATILTVTSAEPHRAG